MAYVENVSYVGLEGSNKSIIQALGRLKRLFKLRKDKLSNGEKKLIRMKLEDINSYIRGKI